MELSSKTRSAIAKYGADVCLAAFRLSSEGGEGPSTIVSIIERSKDIGKAELKTVAQADAAINAGRELKDYQAQKAEEATRREAQNAARRQREEEEASKRVAARAERIMKQDTFAKLNEQFAYGSDAGKQCALYVYARLHDDVKSARRSIASFAQELNANPFSAMSSSYCQDMQKRAATEYNGGMWLDWIIEQITKNEKPQVWIVKTMLDQLERDVFSAARFSTNKRAMELAELEMKCELLEQVRAAYNYAMKSPEATEAAAA